MNLIRQAGFILTGIALTFAVHTKAQNSTVIEDYIKKYKPLAIEEMQRTGVPASIKLAQGIHETMAGTSNLVIKSNNHFGIKCKSTWTGESVKHTDDAPNECFRAYSCAQDSYKDHSDFLRNNKRYAQLFELDPLDYEGWAYGLKKAGYATNPKYSQALISIINRYNLQECSEIALGRRKDESAIALAVNTAPQIPVTEEAEPEVNYPQGVFAINETKVIYAKKGTSLLTIANTYNIPLFRLADFNELDKNMELLPKGQLLYLQLKRRTGNEEFHIVKKNETLVDIAQLQAIRLEALLELNHLSSTVEQPNAGEKLYLKAKAPAPPRLAAAGNTRSKNAIF